MRSINVKFIGATNTKPARLKVWTSGVKAKYYIRNNFDIYEAVKDYAKELGWIGSYIRAVFSDDTDVFVCKTKDYVTIR